MSLLGRQSFHVSTCGEVSTSSRCEAVCSAALVRRRTRRCRREAHLQSAIGIYIREHGDRAGAPSSVCQATKAAAANTDIKEAHKIFDEAFITVKSGDGGSGEIVEAGRGKYVKNHKYHPGGNQPKQLWLPASAPADGADGADVYVICDPSLDNLLHLHKSKQWFAPRGAKGNPAAGSSGPKRNAKIKKSATPPLEIPVPQGTVIKRKSNGQVLGEVLQPGDRVLVAKGGKGGAGITAPSRTQKQKDLRTELKTAAKTGSEIVSIEDVNWRDDSKGLPGQQLGLQLLLRVVADVGIVGFPNAGKSSLLSGLTRASPEVAPYPFTTLMPNLGVMSAGQGPVLADLPGLIEGAHTGKGLGRMFLRHLRRTRVLLHVVDASAPDPATDYLAVREELRMYNPSYVTRLHVVALNKMDVEDAGALRDEVAAEVLLAARQLQQQHAADIPGVTVPSALVPCSAICGEGLQQLAAALQAALQQSHPVDSRHHLERSHSISSGSHSTYGEQQKDSKIEVGVSGITSAVSAALSGAAGGNGSSQHAQDDGIPHSQQQQLQQQECVEVAHGTDDAQHSDPQPVFEDHYESEDEFESEDDDEMEEHEVGEDWEEAQEAAAASSSSSSSNADKDADDIPAPLASDDPDRWLFELTEEQLLQLADRLE